MENRFHLIIFTVGDSVQAMRFTPHIRQLASSAYALPVVVVES